MGRVDSCFGWQVGRNEEGDFRTQLLCGGGRPAADQFCRYSVLAWALFAWHGMQIDVHNLASSTLYPTLEHDVTKACLTDGYCPCFRDPNVTLHKCDSLSLTASPYCSVARKSIHYNRHLDCTRVFCWAGCSW